MRYKLFGRHTGLRVSELALGVGNFGTKWGYGSAPDEARRMFDQYVAAGGNFLDAANNYQFGEAETLLGEFMGTKRDELIVATKYSFGETPDAPITGLGNNRRNMIRSVEASLRRLKTDRIDLYWVHIPDEVTPAEEIVRGLDDLVRSGKIIYAGLSDFPAWRVARAATIAEVRGAAPIAGLQIEYSLVERTPERELLPMANALGIGVVGWSPLGGGLLTGKYRRGEKGRATAWNMLFHQEDDARKKATVDAVLQVAEEVGRTPGQVALAWVASKGVLPILGPRTTAQLEENLGAATLSLSADQLGRLERSSEIAAGFPHEMISRSRAALVGGDLTRTDSPVVPVA